MWRLLAAALLIVVVAAIIGAWSSESRPVEYRAQAQLSLMHTPDGAGLAAALARLRHTADRAIGHSLRPAVITLVAHPGDPTVAVLATAPTPRLASHAANTYATEVVAADRGVDRAALAARLRQLKRQIAAARPGPQRLRKRRTYARLAKRQVTDSDVQAAVIAVRVSGPSPVHSGAAAGLVGAVIAAAVISVLLALARRRIA